MQRLTALDPAAPGLNLMLHIMSAAMNSGYLSLHMKLSEMLTLAFSNTFE
jgi:hypothetical protein